MRQVQLCCRIFLLVVILCSSSLDARNDHDDTVQYVYDNYYDSQVVSKRQFRDCVDHRDYCPSIRHLCITSSSNDGEDNNTDRDAYKDTQKLQRWIYAHCPYTCNLCATHQIISNVPTEQSIASHIKARVRQLPENNELYSKLNPDVNIYTIRDAMTGNAASKHAIGIQYIMSTTAALHHGVTYEQRQQMIQHVLQTQHYYTSVVLPMLPTNTTTTTTTNDSVNATAQCYNKSPYCTYWAVVFQRCQDEFYHPVMSKHCTVTCQRCHEVIPLVNDNDDDKISIKTTSEENKTFKVNLRPGQVWKKVFDSVKAIDSSDDAINASEARTERTTPTMEHRNLDTEKCLYDPEWMPNVWYPHTHLNPMFDRIVHMYSTKNNKDDDGDNKNHKQQKLTILSQPLQYNTTDVNADDGHSTAFQKTNTIDRPWILQIDHFLSDAECDHILQLGNSLGYEYNTYHSNNTNDEYRTSNSTRRVLNEQDVTSEQRSGATTWCHWDCSHNDTVLQEIYELVQNLVHIPSSHYESIQILQYQQGEFYKV
jgi:ShK domain-like